MVIHRSVGGGATPLICSPVFLSRVKRQGYDRPNLFFRFFLRCTSSGHRLKVREFGDRGRPSVGDEGGDMQSVSKDLIAILNRIAASNVFPIEFGATVSMEEIGLVANLLDRGFLDGWHTENQEGVPCNATVTGISLAGREYVDELENERFGKSGKGRLLSFLKYAGIFVLGILGTLLTQLIAKKLGLN